MWDGYFASLGGMLEVPVAAGLSNLVPPIIQQPPNDLSARFGHPVETLLALYTQYTHSACKIQPLNRWEAEIPTVRFCVA
jgi:hypothetical protein